MVCLLKTSYETTGSPELCVQALGVVPENVVLELIRDRRALDLPVLGSKIAPGNIRAEQEPIATDAALLNLAQQPGRTEPNRPRGVGVDLVAFLDQLEEAR